jgi:membrane protein implicated in regulation of membrane protease activity
MTQVIAVKEILRFLGLLGLHTLVWVMGIGAVALLLLFIIGAIVYLSWWGIACLVVGGFILWTTFLEYRGYWLF